MDHLKLAIRNIGVEIPLFLYMITAFIRNPVLHNLIFEKLCLESYTNRTFCANIAEYHDDKDIHNAFSVFSAYSLYILMIPSMITTIVLGIASDYWNMKIPLLIPLLGALVNSVNLVVQAIYLHASPYYFLIGDAIFGICGGYLSILSTSMSYGVKTTNTSLRSYRIAGLEAAIGLGGTIGYIFSGTLRVFVQMINFIKAFGYTYCFVLIVILQSLGFFFVVIFVKDPKIETPPLSEISTHVGVKLRKVFKDFYGMLAKKRPTRRHINLVLAGLAAEFIIFAGLLDIQYSYLRFKLAWGDQEYGWFSGLCWGSAAITMMALYPYFRYRGASDANLANFGLILKIIFLFLMAFVSSTAMAYAVAVFNFFNRFVNTGIRSLLASLIETNEQGKMFSMVSLLEGVTSLLAALIYFKAYPWTLHFFPGFLFVFSSVLLIPLAAILWYCDRDLKKISARRQEAENT